MLGMMGNGNKERGLQMGREDVMRAITQELLGGTPNQSEATGSTPSKSALRDEGAAVMRALQAGDVDAFTAGLQRFIMAMEEMELDENPFDLEVG